MILVFGGAAATGEAFNTPTMTGETFTSWVGTPVGTDNIAAAWAVNSAVGGQTQVTLTCTVASDMHLHVLEITGQTATPRDAQGTHDATTGINVSTTGATTTPQDLIVAFFSDNSTNAPLVVGSGYTQVELSADANGGDTALSETKTVVQTGVQNATASGSGADTVQQIIVAISGTTSGTGQFEAGADYSMGRLQVRAASDFIA